MTLNKLQRMESQLRSLPIQTLLKSQVTLFVTLADSVEAQSIEVNTAAYKLNALRAIKKAPELLNRERQLCWESVNKITNEITVLISAQQLLPDQISHKVLVLKRTVQNLTSKISKNWNDLCSLHKEHVTGIKLIVEKVDLKAMSRLQKVQSALTPDLDGLPITDEGIQTVIDAIDWTRTAISSYGIEDSVQAFLQASRNGEGDPKCLLKPEVQKYLESHTSIWNSLKVVWP